jgi:hypothetical protein
MKIVHFFFDILSKFKLRTKYFYVMLILKCISCIFDKKLHFLDFQVFFMYFGFFQSFDKVFGIAQKNTSN